MYGLLLPHQLSIIGKDFLLIFCSSFNYHNGKGFLYFVIVSSYMDCYPIPISKDVLLVLWCGINHHNSKGFFVFGKCKQLYYLLPHHYLQGFLALFFLLQIFALSFPMRQKSSQKYDSLKFVSSLQPGEQVLLGKRLLSPRNIYIKELISRI